MIRCAAGGRATDETGARTGCRSRPGTCPWCPDRLRDQKRWPIAGSTPPPIRSAHGRDEGKQTQTRRRATGPAAAESGEQDLGTVAGTKPWASGQAVVVVGSTKASRTQSRWGLGVGVPTATIGQGGRRAADTSGGGKAVVREEGTPMRRSTASHREEGVGEMPDPTSTKPRPRAGSPLAAARPT